MNLKYMKVSDFCVFIVRASLPPFWLDLEMSMCLLFCFVIFWMICCYVWKKKKKKIVDNKKKYIYESFTFLNKLQEKMNFFTTF